MAKAKPIPKPMFDVKHDFVDALDATLQAAINLQACVDSALDLGAIDARISQIMKQRADELRRALSSGN